jgi:hypothetical protein
MKLYFYAPMRLHGIGWLFAERRLQYRDYTRIASDDKIADELGRIQKEEVMA